MSAPAGPLSARRPLLLYATLSAGMEFPPSDFETPADMVQRYMAITGDASPLYFDPDAAAAAGLPGPIVPPGLAAVWARKAYLSAAEMPPGGVIASLRAEHLAPVLVGRTLRLTARITELDRAHPRRKVVITATASDDSTLAGRVTISARWSEVDVDDR
jgi:acyl dehydratase